MQLEAIWLDNIRVFEGTNRIPLSPGLTVLMGRNNSGKSTALRASLMAVTRGAPPARGGFRRSGTKESSVMFEFAISPSECQTAFGFDPERIRGVRLSRTRVVDSEPLSTHRVFEKWEYAPVLAVRYRWTDAGNYRVTRLLSSSRTSWIDVGDDRLPAVIDGTEYVATFDAREFGGLNQAPLLSQGAATPDPFLAFWEHDRVETTSKWIEQPLRRLSDASEAPLLEVLTFLKMKHPIEFEHVARALRRALPEFADLDFIDVSGSAFGYRPGFVTRSSGGTPIARESVGAGAWEYLCILTAARAAKATGARVLLLDEPHLYLHPGLERLLIDELTDPSKWESQPLQVVASTHSPAFVNAAAAKGVLNLLEWTDPERTTVRVHTVAGDSKGSIFDILAALPSDVLYADRLVFVEGPSDAIALQVLARERCAVTAPIRFVPLRETDAQHSEIARYFRVIAESHGLGFKAHGLLVLDGDKKAQCERAWSKGAGDQDPQKVLTVRWADGDRGNDFESAFCDEEFLVAYFESRGVPESSSRSVIQARLANLVFDSPNVGRAHKGCTAVRGMHEDLLGGQDDARSKADDLEALMRFYVSHAEQAVAQGPRTLLAKLEDALRALNGD